MRGTVTVSNVVALRPLVVPAPVVADPVTQLPGWARQEAERRQALVLLEARGGDAGVSVATLRRWRKALEAGGLAALAPHYQGRQRSEQPWDARALQYVQLPGRLNSGEIAANLRADGFGDVSPAQVRRWRKTLPSNLDETSKKKLGTHHYRLNETPYVIRDWGHVPVGYLYEMDGHTCDFYIEHPTTGSYFRPELTFLLDVRSQYIVDFWLGGFENSMDLRWLVSRAFVTQDHVCHELHIDPGAGRAHSMADPIVGFCAKLGVDLHFALPGNARGKGLNEGEYKHFEGRFGKVMPTYLHNRTDDEMRLFASKWKKGLVPRITVQQLYDLVLERYVTPRRNEPRKGLDNQSPADLWATLPRNPVGAPLEVIVRPRIARTVQNGRVTLHKRRYELPQPARAQWEDRQVVVHYDEWTDSSVWIYDDAERFLCEAPLVHRRPGIPVSRVEEKLARTAEGQRKRLQLKIDEANARAHMPISTAAVLDALDAPTGVPEPSTDAATVLLSGISFTAPPGRALRKRRNVSPAALEHLRVEVEADDAAVETTTTHDRIRRALDLESRLAAGETLADDDARWLAIYTTSDEYHSRRSLMDDFDLS